MILLIFILVYSNLISYVPVSAIIAIQTVFLVVIVFLFLQEVAEICYIRLNLILIAIEARNLSQTCCPILLYNVEDVNQAVLAWSFLFCSYNGIAGTLFCALMHNTKIPLWQNNICTFVHFSHSPLHSPFGQFY